MSELVEENLNEGFWDNHIVPEVFEVGNRVYVMPLHTYGTIKDKYKLPQYDLSIILENKDKEKIYCSSRDCRKNK